jgi:hypothetical protein
VIIPYFDSVYGPLQAYLTAQHTEETHLTVSTLGTCLVDPDPGGQKIAPKN